MPQVTSKNYYEVEAIVHAKRNGGAKEYTIIDIRDPDERESEGFIPYSVNIPAYELRDAMKMRGGAFEKKYGVKKPGKKSPIIVYCRSGQRSGSSAEYLVNEKYESVASLHGGHDEWEKNRRVAEDADL